LERAILYARVSGDDRGREGRNLAGQLDMCREYALSQGWRVVDELAEDERGASSASLDLPQLNNALEMARQGVFDILVVRELDRLARGLAKQLIVEQEFKRAGVQIEYVLGEYADTPEGSLMKNVRAVVAEYERLKINERMVRGRRQKVKSGSVLANGHAPYGYKLVKDGDKTLLEVDEEKAAVVRMFFDWYVNEGLTMRAISDRLSELGAPLPSGISKNTMGWLASTVGKMLKNETYAGVWYFGKYKKRGGHRANPREHWIPVDVPAIVSRDTWQAAQERLVENKMNARRNKKHDYLMSGRVTCGQCGCKCCGSSNGKYLYYICNSYSNRETRPRDCDLKHIRAEWVDRGVWNWVEELLTHPEVLEAGFAEYQARQDEEEVPLRERLKVIDDLLAENQAQLDRLLDLYLAGDFPKDLLVDRKTRLEETIAALDKERAGLEARLNGNRLTKEQIQTIKEFAAEVSADLEAADFATKRKVIELLDIRVTLTREEGKPIAYVDWHLTEKQVGGCDPNHQCRSSSNSFGWRVWDEANSVTIVKSPQRASLLFTVRLILGHDGG